MTQTLANRLALLGPLSEQHLQDVTPIVADWAERAEALSGWVSNHAIATTLPVTVCVTPLKPLSPS